MNVYESMGKAGERLLEQDKATVKRIRDHVARNNAKASYKRQCETSPLKRVVKVGTAEWAAIKRLYREFDYPWPPNAYGMAIEPTNQPTGVSVRPVGRIQSTSLK